MPSELARHWTLDPAVAFLNHGSFGATPRSVLEVQRAWRERMEREPVAFFSRDLEPALDEAREALAAFVGADPDDLAFLHNASGGVTSVVRSLRLQPGDELLTTDHAYNAARNALEWAAAEWGAKVVVAPVAFPGVTPGGVMDSVLAHVTPRTRLMLVDHITSPTALLLPVTELVAALRERGVDTLVDGAHAPGMVDLDIRAIGAAYYTGNCHKWLCAPKGAAFLHVRRDRHDGLRPLVISHGTNSPRSDRSRFHLEFDWQGTDDPTAYLAVPAAIAFGASLLPGGWPALRDRNRGLALLARDTLCEALGEPKPAPDEMLAGMIAVPLALEATPASVQGIALYGDPLHDTLLERHAIQVMITPWPQRPDGGPWRRLVRVSAAPYVGRDDVERLAVALRDVFSTAG